MFGVKRLGLGCRIYFVGLYRVTYGLRKLLAKGYGRARMGLFRGCSTLPNSCAPQSRSLNKRQYCFSFDLRFFKPLTYCWVREWIPGPYARPHAIPKHGPLVPDVLLVGPSGLQDPKTQCHMGGG